MTRTLTHDSTTTVTLRGDFRAPRQARRTVHAACATSDLPARLVDDAASVAGELVHICIRPGREPVQVEILPGPGVITVRVRDAALASPSVTGAPGPVGSWEVVKHLSASFGYRWDTAGREMWARVRTRPQTICA